MNEQAQQMLMFIFGFIAFDYDLQTLDDNQNELTQAFYSLLNTMQILFRLPIFLGRIFVSLNFPARRARKIIDRHSENMIEHELNETSEMKDKRKRTNLIASLVTSLQENEQLEANKAEEDKKR
jgi:hypothetical protein